jgi:flagellar hook assembly protein FlgD
VFTVSPLSGSTLGPAVLTRSGAGAAMAVLWDGRRTDGAVAPNGTYRLTLAAIDAAGNRTPRSWNVRLDTVRPTVVSTASPQRFSPNGDGASDTSRLAWTSSEPISGTVRILHGTTIIRSWTISGLSAGATRWSGTDAAGRRVADGTYSYRVAGRDAAGNPVSRSIGVIVDRTLSTLRWSPGLFYPQDGDALAATSRTTFSLSRSATVTLAIYHGTTRIRTVWTNRLLGAGPHAWTWNGRNSAGAIVPPGRYAVRVDATSSLGTSTLMRTVIVDAFAVTLSATTLTAGQTLTVTLLTAEPLRASPAVSFTQTGKATVARTATSLGGGRYRVSFTVASGGSGPGLIRVAGRDTSGGINRTTASVAIR